MGLTQFLKIAIETFKPHRYKGLTQRSYMKCFFFFLTLTFIYVLLISGLNATQFISNMEDNETGFSNLKSFDLTLNLETENPITLSNYPLIVVDSGKNTTTLENEDVLVTGNTLTKRIFFWDKSVGIHEINLKSFISKTLENKLFLIILIPFILLLVFLYVAIKYFFAAMIIATISLLFLLFGDNKAGIGEIFKASVYSLIIYYIGNIISFFIHIEYVGLISYSIFFVIILFLLKEDDRTNFEGDSSKDDEDEGF